MKRRHNDTSYTVLPHCPVHELSPGNVRRPASDPGIDPAPRAGQGCCPKATPHRCNRHERSHSSVWWLDFPTRSRHTLRTKASTVEQLLHIQPSVVRTEYYSPTSAEERDPTTAKMMNGSAFKAGIKVIVVGARLLGPRRRHRECHRQGRDLEICEALPELQTLGHIISFGPNAGHIFYRWSNGEVAGACDL